MALRILFVSLLMLMIYFSLSQSSPLSDDVLIENYPPSNLLHTSSDTVQPLNFILFLCQQQEQYPLKLTKKLCSNAYKLQKQQRGKRVGWTISV